MLADTSAEAKGFAFAKSTVVALCPTPLQGMLPVMNVLSSVGRATFLKAWSHVGGLEIWERVLSLIM